MYPSNPILAVIPAYNEAKKIAWVVEKTLSFLPTLVVDDGSSDATAEIARQAGARVLQQKPNQGKGAALRAAFRLALAEGCAAVLTLDADGQHDPSEIPLFLEAFAETSADLIIGQRDFSRMPPVRKISNTIGTRLLSLAAGQPIPDNQSGYRLISARLMESTLESQEAGFEYEVEMIIQCLARDYKLVWVPIQTIYADEHSHIRPLHHARKFIQTALRARKALHKQ